LCFLVVVVFFLVVFFVEAGAAFLVAMVSPSG
jgi:hypothetical protein